MGICEVSSASTPREVRETKYLWLPKEKDYVTWAQEVVLS